MYLPASFREDRIEELHAIIASVRLATLVTNGPDGLAANHVPMIVDAAASPNGTLIGHLARANPQWKQLAGGTAIAIFLGASTYVTPSWYPSKAETGEVVPTWNFVAVHAYGRPVVIEDKPRLRSIVERLTTTLEAPRAAPWHVADAPEPYLDRMLGAIVGFEIPIDRIEGKLKLSQNKSDRDRDGVRDGVARERPAGHDELLRLSAAGAARRPG
jgi:transcriptional regulator